MTTAPLPLAPYYARTLLDYFSFASSDERLEYWKSFAEQNGYTGSSPPADSPDLQQAFSAFLSKYKQLGITSSSLKLNYSIPSSPFYSAILDTYFSSSSPTEKKDIWNLFVESEGASLSPPDPDAGATKIAFEAFIKMISTASVSSLLNDTMGSLSSRFRIDVMEKFALSRGGISPLSIPDDTATQADLNAFVHRYLALGVTQTSIEMTNDIPGIFYQNYLNGFFGNLSSVEQKDIWNAFLYSQGYGANPPDSPALQASFAKYINDTASRLNVYESATMLSPQEMKSRLISNSLLTSLKNFLNTTQSLVQIQSSTLIFYGQWQKNYTDMMTRVPTLSSGAPPKVQTNTSDLSAFTFGYDKISLEDVIKWGISQAVTIPGSPALFGNRSPGTDQSGHSFLLGQYSFQVIQTGSTKTLQISADEDSSGVHVMKTITIEDPSAIPDPIHLSFNDMVQQASQAYQQIFAENPAFITAIQGQGGIPGRYLGIVNPTSAQQAQDTQELQQRTEVNAALQQAVENIRSQRDQVQNFTSQFQAALNNSKNAIDQQTSLFTSILESLDSIMQVINSQRK